MAFYKSLPQKVKSTCCAITLDMFSEIPFRFLSPDPRYPHSQSSYSPSEYPQPGMLRRFLDSCCIDLSGKV